MAMDHTEVFQAVEVKRGVKEYYLCENAGEYVSFDAAHLTEKANHQLCQTIAEWKTNSLWLLHPQRDI